MPSHMLSTSSTMMPLTSGELASSTLISDNTDLISTDSSLSNANPLTADENPLSDFSAAIGHAELDSASVMGMLPLESNVDIDAPINAPAPQFAPTTADTEAWLQQMQAQQSLAITATTQSVASDAAAVTANVRGLSGVPAAQLANSSTLNTVKGETAPVDDAVQDVLTPTGGDNKRPSAPLNALHDSRWSLPADAAVDNAVANAPMRDLRKEAADVTRVDHALRADVARASVVQAPHAKQLTEQPVAEVMATRATTSASVLGSVSVAALSDAASTPSTTTLPPAAAAADARSTLLKMDSAEAKWGEQMLAALKDRVQMQINQRSQQTTIRLDPPELGSLEIFLSQEAGKVSVSISASHSDVARLLQSTSERLRAELAADQFTDVDVRTGNHEQGERQFKERQQAFFADAIAANDAADDNASQKSKLMSDVLVSV